MRVGAKYSPPVSHIYKRILGQMLRSSLAARSPSLITHHPALGQCVTHPTPGPGRVKDRPRRGGIVERPQRIVNHVYLLSQIAWLAKRVAKGPFEMHCSRRANLFGDLAQAGDNYCGYASRLNHAGDQSNGLIAETSGGGEQHGVDPLLLEHAGHLRRSGSEQRRNVGRLDMAHKAVAGA